MKKVVLVLLLLTLLTRACIAEVVQQPSGLFVGKQVELLYPTGFTAFDPLRITVGGAYVFKIGTDGKLTWSDSVASSLTKNSTGMAFGGTLTVPSWLLVGGDLTVNGTLGGPTVTGMQTSITGLQTSVGTLQTTTSGLSSSVTSLDASVSGLQSATTELTTDLTSVTSRVTIAESNVGTLQSQTATLQTNYTALDAEVDTKDTPAARNTAISSSVSTHTSNQDAHHAKIHGSSHMHSGSDEFNLTGLHGLLGDAQDPINHASRHRTGGVDVISVTQAQVDNLVSDKTTIQGSISTLNSTVEFKANKGAANGYAALDANSLVVQNPASASTTAAAGKIPVAGIDGKLAADWISGAGTHAATHTYGGNDAITLTEGQITDLTSDLASKVPVPSTPLYIMSGYQEIGSLFGYPAEPGGKYVIHVLVSADGRNFTDLNRAGVWNDPDTNTDVGTRDMSICWYNGYWWGGYPLYGSGGPPQKFLLARSSNLTTWERVGEIIDVNAVLGIGEEHTIESGFSGEWYVDDSGLPHFLFPVTITWDEGGQGIYEMHPTDSNMSTWSTPVRLLASAEYDPYIIKVNGVYHLWTASGTDLRIHHYTSATFPTADTFTASGLSLLCGGGHESQVVVPTLDGTSYRLLADDSIGQGIWYRDYIGNPASFPGSDENWSAPQEVNTPVSMSGATIVRVSGAGHWSTALRALLLKPPANDAPNKYMFVPTNVSNPAGLFAGVSGDFVRVCSITSSLGALVELDKSATGSDVQTWRFVLNQSNGAGSISFLDGFQGSSIFLLSANTSGSTIRWDVEIVYNRTNTTWNIIRANGKAVYAATESVTPSIDTAAISPRMILDNWPVSGTPKTYRIEDAVPDSKYMLYMGAGKEGVVRDIFCLLPGLTSWADVRDYELRVYVDAGNLTANQLSGASSISTAYLAVRAPIGVLFGTLYDDVGPAVSRNTAYMDVSRANTGVTPTGRGFHLYLPMPYTNGILVQLWKYGTPAMPITPMYGCVHYEDGKIPSAWPYKRWRLRSANASQAISVEGAVVPLMNVASGPGMWVGMFMSTRGDDATFLPQYLENGLQVNANGETTYPYEWPDMENGFGIQLFGFEEGVIFNRDYGCTSYGEGGPSWREMYVWMTRSPIMFTNGCTARVDMTAANMLGDMQLDNLIFYYAP